MFRYKHNMKTGTNVRVLSGQILVQPPDCLMFIPDVCVSLVQVTFTTKRITCPQVTINNMQIPVQTEVKYLGVCLDQKLTWQKHVKTKCQKLNLKL
jgi:hypothetical protein